MIAKEEEIIIKKIGGEDKPKTTGFSSADDEIEVVGSQKRSRRTGKKGRGRQRIIDDWNLLG